jgi:hypothetical protein
MDGRGSLFTRQKRALLQSDRTMTVGGAGPA